MPRAGRVFFDGAYYHVYNRAARGARVLAEDGETERFVALLREVMARDQVTVLAWCVLSDHYHLALTTGPVPLDRPMRSLQQRFTRQYNARHRVFGPLWQSRYRAKLVTDQRYLDQLLVYIHMNPVAAGIVAEPADYQWSGHRELVGKVDDPLVAVDEVLRLFGTTRRAARSSYRRTVETAAAEPWVRERPGQLPWWRLGRPPAAEAEESEADPDASGSARRQQDAERRERERPRLSVEEFLRLGATALGIDLDALASRGRSRALVEARELLAASGVERYSLRVKDIAAALAKHPVTGSGWVMRGVHRRHTDATFRDRYEQLDAALAQRGNQR
jgi:REP element-mobilizing transposase RayT